MNEELERNADEQAESVSSDETFAPRSKYERIMIAAAEAGRLNEEMRRKGIKLDHKVTIEAVLRVDEGKVKGTLREYEGVQEAPAPHIPEMPASPLFGEPSAPLSATRPSDAGRSTVSASHDDGDSNDFAPEDNDDEGDDVDDDLDIIDVGDDVMEEDEEDSREE
jgi:hypothetical protein